MLAPRLGPRTIIRTLVTLSAKYTAACLRNSRRRSAPPPGRRTAGPPAVRPRGARTPPQTMPVFGRPPAVAGAAGDDHGSRPDLFGVGQRQSKAADVGLHIQPADL